LAFDDPYHSLFTTGTASFAKTDQALKGFGVRVLKTPSEHREECFCVRLVRTIRRVLRFLIQINEAARPSRPQLRIMHEEFAKHYNQGQPHSP
jgi:hypothetical protein